MSYFIPPKMAPPLVTLAQDIFPLYAKVAHHLTVQVDADSARWFAQIKNYPGIICPNHPAPEDPMALFGLSRKMGENFYFMTAREVFMQHPSVRSVWLEWVGCYSIARGTPDRNSLRATKRLLLNGNHKVAIFPEGEISHQNDRLTALENGIAQIALDVCKAKYRSGQSAPLYLLPVAIFYRFRDDHLKELVKILKEFENSLGTGMPGGVPSSTRIYNCYLTMLADEEALHDLSCAGTFEDRLRKFLLHATGELELEMLGDEQKGRIIDRLHHLKSILVHDKFDVRQEPNEQDISWYRSIRRLTRLSALTSESFHSSMSQEEFAELLTILSWEIHNEDRVPHFAKTAFIAATEPVDAMHYAMQDGNSSGAPDIIRQVQERITQKLNELARKHPTQSSINGAFEP
jgi:1-acyl-sn-glycerol-3-phosphate acyltransferase